ncbi:MAG: acyl carrier protein phosphodiesterase [Arcticibacterium sp.]|jgi:acyl carrier protein phosphodiesterase
MNYLAHVFLSGHNEEILFGNLLEDFMHGRVEHERNNHLSTGIKNGIKLHRRIDTITDSHGLVKVCKNVFQPEFGRYASIVTDVLFDHFLIKNWEIFSQEDFSAFRQRSYKALEGYHDLMPEGLDKLVKSMTKHDWLKAYEFDEGLERAFIGLNSKIKSGPDLLPSIALMHENYDVINDNFLSFFNILNTYSINYIKSIS